MLYNYLDYKCFSIPHHRKPNRFKPSKQMMKLLEGYLQIPNWGHTENNMNRLYHKKILLLDIYLSCLCVYVVISSHAKTHMRKNNSFVCLFICVICLRSMIFPVKATTVSQQAASFYNTHFLYSCHQWISIICNLTYSCTLKLFFEEAKY